MDTDDPAVEKWLVDEGIGYLDECGTFHYGIDPKPSLSQSEAESELFWALEDAFQEVLQRARAEGPADTRPATPDQLAYLESLRVPLVRRERAALTLGQASVLIEHYKRTPPPTNFTRFDPDAPASPAILERLKAKNMSPPPDVTGGQAVELLNSENAYIRYLPKSDPGGPPSPVLQGSLSNLGIHLPHGATQEQAQALYDEELNRLRVAAGVSPR